MKQYDIMMPNKVLPISTYDGVEFTLGDKFVYAYFITLAYHHEKNVPTVRDIAINLGMPPQEITPIIEKLTKLGLLTYVLGDYCVDSLDDEKVVSF